MALRNLSLAAAAAVIAGCASVPPSLEIAVGANVSEHMPWSQDGDGGFDGPKDTVRFTVRYDISDVTFCSLNHVSHLSAGWPVNSRREDWLDTIECGVSFGGKRR